VVLIGKAIPQVVSFLKVFGPAALDGLDTAKKAFESSGGSLAKTFGALLGPALDVIWDAIVTKVKAINWMQVGSDVIQSIADGGLQNSSLPGIMSTMFDMAMNVAVAKVRSFFPSFDLTQLGIDMLQGLVNGIRSALTAVSAAAQEVASAVLGPLKQIFRWGSPSKEMAHLGAMVSAGFAQGIDRQGLDFELPQPAAAATNVAQQLQPPAFDTRKTDVMLPTQKWTPNVAMPDLAGMMKSATRDVAMPDLSGKLSPLTAELGGFSPTMGPTAAIDRSVPAPSFANAQPNTAGGTGGDTNVSFGSGAIVIQVDGSKDPQATATALAEHFTAKLGHALEGLRLETGQ
jgi:hypothetical protein